MSPGWKEVMPSSYKFDRLVPLFLEETQFKWRNGCCQPFFLHLPKATLSVIYDTQKYTQSIMTGSLLKYRLVDRTSSRSVLSIHAVEGRNEK